MVYNINAPVQSVQMMSEPSNENNTSNDGDNVQMLQKPSFETLTPVDRFQLLQMAGMVNIVNNDTRFTPAVYDSIKTSSILNYFNNKCESVNSTPYNNDSTYYPPMADNKIVNIDFKRMVEISKNNLHNVVNAVVINYRNLYVFKVFLLTDNLKYFEYNINLNIVPLLYFSNMTFNIIPPEMGELTDKIYPNLATNMPSRLLGYSVLPYIKYSIYDMMSLQLYNEFDGVGNVMFQLIYTLACFSRIGLTHNDCHTGNIRMRQVKEPVAVTFNCGNNTCRTLVINNYYPCFYDYDQGSLTGISRELFDTYQIRPSSIDFSNFPPMLVQTDKNDGNRRDIFIITIAMILFIDWQYKNISVTDNVSGNTIKASREKLLLFMIHITRGGIKNYFINAYKEDDFIMSLNFRQQYANYTNANDNTKNMTPNDVTINDLGHTLFSYGFYNDEFGIKNNVFTSENMMSAREILYDDEAWEILDVKFESNHKGTRHVSIDSYDDDALRTIFHTLQL